MRKLPELTDVELTDGTYGTIVFVYANHDAYEVEVPVQPGVDEWDVKTVMASDVAKVLAPPPTPRRRAVGE